MCDSSSMKEIFIWKFPTCIDIQIQKNDMFKDYMIIQYIE